MIGIISSLQIETKKEDFKNIMNLTLKEDRKKLNLKNLV